MTSEYTIDISRLEFVFSISNSQSSKVRKAILKNADGTYFKDVATKTYIDYKKSEIDILSQLKHKNVISFIGASKTVDGNTTLIMEYATKGNLYDYLRKQNNRLSFDHALEWSKHCANALSYLESEKVVHRDIKSPNYLLSDDFTEINGVSINVLKLCDFGISHKSKSTITTTRSSVNGFSNLWAAPEVRRRPNSFSICSDIYSLAVVIWELFTGEVPYSGCDDVEITIKVSTGVTLSTDGIQNESLKNMLEKCWSLEKCDRYGIRRVLEILDNATEQTTSDVEHDGQTPQLTASMKTLFANLAIASNQTYESVPFTPRKSEPKSPDRIVTNLELLEVAKYLGIHWKTFGMKLGYKLPEIQNWETNHRLNVIDAIVAMLHAWKCKVGSDHATVGNLVKHLDNFENIDPENYSFLIDDSLLE